MPLESPPAVGAPPAAPAPVPASTAPPIAAPVVPAGVQPAPGAPPQGTPLIPAQVVSVPLDQLQTLTAAQARLAALESEVRSQQEAAQAEQVRLMASRGEVENALRVQREQAEAALNAERTQRNAIEERAKRYALDGELSRVLASQPLVPGGAEQLTQLWRSQLTVEPHGDSYQVRTPTFQTVSDFVAAQLAQPHYAHFLRPQSGGGGTANGGSSGASTTPTPPANPAATPAPKTLGEAVILHMQSMKGDPATADPRLNLSQPMGLRRAK